MDVEDLYRRYGPMIMRRCRQLLSDEEQALDATQDVFVQVLQHRRRLEDTYPSILLYRIATNLCLNRIRDRKSPLTDAASGIAVLRVLEACQKSLDAHGAPVPLQSSA